MSESDKTESERDVGAHPADVSATKWGKAFSKIGRALSEKELGSPGAQRLLLEELERLQRQNEELAEYRERYHTADKERAVLEQRLRAVVGLDVLFATCLSVGSALVTLAPAIWDRQPYAAILLITGFVLLIGAIIAKKVKS